MKKIVKVASDQVGWKRDEHSIPPIDVLTLTIRFDDGKTQLVELMRGKENYRLGGAAFFSDLIRKNFPQLASLPIAGKSDRMEVFHLVDIGDGTDDCATIIRALSDAEVAQRLLRTFDAEEKETAAKASAARHSSPPPPAAAIEPPPADKRARVEEIS